VANTGYNSILDRLPIIDTMGTDALTAAQQSAIQRANVAAQQQNTTLANSYGSPSGTQTNYSNTQGSYSGGPGKSLYDALIAGGFSPSAARTMYGIAGAESGYRGNAQGDLGLQNSTWGPSYGYFQVRTLKGSKNGDDRNLQTLASGGLARQIAAAYAISNGGRNFGPWSTYNSGSYRKFLPSFDTGAWNIPQDTVAQIHQGEMVVPPQAAEKLRQTVGAPEALGIQPQPSQQNPQQQQMMQPQGPPPPPELNSYALSLLKQMGRI
jgi:hypothetical protein